MTDILRSMRSTLDWFEGFSEVIGDAPPTAEQWAKVRAKLAALKEAAEAGPSVAATPSTSTGAAQVAPAAAAPNGEQPKKRPVFQKFGSAAGAEFAEAESGP